MTGGLSDISNIVTTKKGRAVSGAAFLRSDVDNEALAPFMLVFMLLLQLPGRVLFDMLCIVEVGFIGMHFNVDRISQADTEMARQGRSHFPAITLQIKVYFPTTVIIDRTGRIIPICMLGPISVCRCVRRRPLFDDRRVLLAGSAATVDDDAAACCCASAKRQSEYEYED